MRGCGCWGLALAIGLIFGGGQGLYEGIKSRQPQVMTFQQFEKAQASDGWFKITKCELAVAEAMWMEKFGSINEVFVPVRATGDTDDTKPIALLLQVEDPKIRYVVKEMKELQDEAKDDDKKITEWVLNHQVDMYITRDVEGMIAFGVNEMKSSERDKIKALNGQLSSDFTLLKEGEKPSLLTGFAMLAGGLLILVFTLVGSATKDKPDAPAENTGAGEPPQNNQGDPPGAVPPPAWNGPPSN